MSTKACIIKWGAIALVVVVAAIVFMDDSEAAGTSAFPAGIMKHMVVEDIEGGHITYSYQTDNAGKIRLVDTVVMYDGKLMSTKQYKQRLIAKAIVKYKIEAKQWVEAAEAKQRAIARAQAEVNELEAYKKNACK